MAGDCDERIVNEVPPAEEVVPETRAFLDKLMECQSRIKDAVLLATTYYDELSPETKVRVKSDLARTGGIMIFGGLMLPAVLREKLGVKEPMSTFHGASAGVFKEIYPGGASLCGNLVADGILAINLLMQLGPQTGLNGMLMLNAALGAIQAVMTQHLGGQKMLAMAVVNDLRRQYEEAERVADAALAAKSKETGSA